MITVLYFGWARERAGTDEDRLDPTGIGTIGALWDRLIGLHPGLAECRASSRMAINMNYADDSDAVTDGVEIAVIPPVAGG